MDAAPTPTITLDAVRWDDADAAQLRDTQQAELRDLYGDEDEPVPLTDDSTIAAMVVLRVDGAAVACGALRVLVPGSWGDGEPGPGTGELKRMFVQPGWRGRGLSRLVLRDLEGRAREVGLRRVVLETGDLQTAAVALYERSGYVRIPAFGGYASSPISVCYAKDLTVR